jgi:hypothetical protein
MNLKSSSEKIGDFDDPARLIKYGRKLKLFREKIKRFTIRDMYKWTAAVRILCYPDISLFCIYKKKSIAVKILP